MKVFRSFLHLLIYSNIWVALCAAALTLGSSTLLDARQLDVITPILVFCSTLLTYNFQRVNRFNHPSKSMDSAMNQWLSGNLFFVRVLMVLSGVGVLSSLFFVRWEIILLLLPLGFLSLAYTVRISFQKAGRVGLRDVPGAKIFWIAITWAGATLALPLLQVHGLELLESSQFWMLIAERLCFVLAITIPFDIRDLTFDDPGKRTIPQLIGARPAKMLSIMMLGTAGVLLATSVTEANGALVLNSVITPGLAFTVNYSLYWPVLLAYVLMLMVLLFVHPKRKDLYYTGVVEGTSLVYGVSMLLVGTQLY